MIMFISDSDETLDVKEEWIEDNVNIKRYLLIKQNQIIITFLFIFATMQGKTFEQVT